MDRRRPPQALAGRARRLRLLAGLEPKALVAALDKLEPVKTGRPKKGQ